MSKSARMSVGKRSKQENFYTMLRLLKYLQDYKFMVIFSLVLTAITNFFSLTAPKLIEQAISFMELPAIEMDLNIIFGFSTLMLIFYICNFLVTMLKNYIIMKLGQNIGYSMRKNTFEKFDKLPVSYFDTHQTGDIISRFTYDVDMIASSMGQNIMSFIASIITLIGSISIMTTMNITLMSTFFITIPLSLVLSYIFTKQARKYHREKSIQMGEVNGYVEDKVTGHKTIKIYGQEINILNSLKEKNDIWGKAYYNSEFYGGSMLRISLMFVTNVTTAAIYVHSTILFLNNQISLSEISSFVLYSKMFTSIVNEVTFITADLQSSFAAADRIFSFLDEVEEVQDNKDAQKLDNFRGGVEFKNVSFYYNKDRAILNNISISAKPNTITAIVGHTGAGKTSLINLLMRFYDPTGGIISFDGVDISNLTRKNLRASCSMVLQDTWLFGGTIFENIVYGKDDATIEDVLEVSKAVSLHEHIIALPDGYDTKITENTVNISQGQKQLITIARAMLLNSKVIILDEATSNVDTLTELNIQNAMKKLMENKTSFVIAHRLSTVKNADKILVLEKGVIIEEGNHEELIELGGNYSKLYNSQFDVLKEIK